MLFSLLSPDKELGLDGFLPFSFRPIGILLAMICRRWWPKPLLLG